jgi:protein-S-isoprenylcysteine O-methyltransferase Ste14
MKWLELKIPPPIVALLCALGMWAIARNTLLYFIQTELKWAFIMIFVIMGIVFAMAGVFAFHRKKTTVNPLHPEKSSSLVTHGIYRITRNPMYCGMAWFLIAWAIFLNSPMALIGLPIFIFYINYFQIIPEEKILFKIFGDAFTEYQTQVRRWL